MFEQPPPTAKEAFGQGFVHGLALLCGIPLVILASMLPSRYRFFLGPHQFLWTDFLFAWSLFGSIGCLVLLSAKDEIFKAVYRAGVLASYGIFLALVIAMWTI
jgi:hypothetical protein